MRVLLDNFKLQGQSPMDVADITMVTVLEDLRTKQAALQKDRPPPNNMSNKALNSPKRRLLSVLIFKVSV